MATWTVEYFTRGAAGVKPTTWCTSGAYEFLWTPNYVVVEIHNTNWDFIGMYGAPALGYPAAVLPAGFPAISFPVGKDIGHRRPEPVPMNAWSWLPPAMWRPIRALDATQSPRADKADEPHGEQEEGPELRYGHGAHTLVALRREEDVLAHRARPISKNAPRNVVVAGEEHRDVRIVIVKGDEKAGDRQIECLHIEPKVGGQRVGGRRAGEQSEEVVKRLVSYSFSPCYVPRS